MGRWLPDDFGSKSFKTVPASSIEPTKSEPAEQFSTSYKLDFTGASKDYWAKKFGELQQEYNKGCTVGKFGKYTPDLDDFLVRMFTLIKESISSEMVKKGYTTEQLQNQFNIIESSFKTISDVIKGIDKENKISSDSLCAFLHGFVNGYMEKFTEVKEKENDKN